MKTRSISLLLASGLAISMLSSCVAPLYSRGEASVTTTTYQPGYRITALPTGYRREVISGNDYYYHNGAYYRRESSGYVVVDAPRSSRYYTDYDRHRTSNQVIRRLPYGYRPVDHGGRQSYQSGGNYYRREGNRYIQVNRPY